MNARPTIGVLAALAVAVAINACSTSSDPAPASTPDAGPADTGTLGWLGGACGGCIAPKCAAQRQACDAEPSCAKHTACAEVCPAAPDGGIDPACLAACPNADNSVATRARVAWDTCITNGAGCEACPKASAPSPLSIFDQKCGPSTETNACAKCEDEKCCDTYKACVDEPECQKGLQQCLKDCPTLEPDCDHGCYDKFPKGVLPWAKRSLCYTVQCTKECVGDPEPCFACVVTGACKTPNARCDTDLGCYRIQECVQFTCPKVTDACITECKKKGAAESGALFDALLACTIVSCGDACSRE